MTIVWIAGLITLSVVAAFFVVRRRAASIELGTMSGNWVAEHRSSEHTYNDR